MELFNYDQNGYYTTTTIAKLDPISKQPMQPARSTTVLLPVGEPEEYQKFKFENDAWVLANIESIVNSMLAQVNEKGTSLKKDDGNGNPIDRTTQEIADDDAIHDKDVLKGIAYANMKMDIYGELESTFGTRKPETATASAMTWDLMKSEPSEYSALGLKSEFTLTGIAIGDLLDTEAKVLDYATQLVANKLAYSKYRLGRVATYTAEIIAIG